MDKSFADQVVIVTGGARGIGRSMVEGFAARGATVVFCDCNEGRSRSTWDELSAKGLKVEFELCDLSVPRAAASFVKGVAERYGQLDVLVNNARSGSRRGMLDEDSASWDETHAVTLKAMFFCSQEAIRQMGGKSRGCIINVSSVAATYVGDESPSYHVAKAGVEQLTRYLAVHAGALGVRVNAVQPGFIVQAESEQRFIAKENESYRARAIASHPLRQVGESSDVLQAVLFLASEESKFISGAVLPVDGALTVQDPWALLARNSQ